MQRLAIIGSGDLGQLIAYHALQDGHYDTVVFFDDFREKGSRVNGCLVIGEIGNVIESYNNGEFDALLIAIGYKHFDKRKACFEQFKGTVPLGRLIHSSSYVAASCKIGEGICIMPGCVLDSNVEIGDNVFINTACCIAHDSGVKAHTFLSPRVAVAGFVVIGSCCNIGINTTIIDNIAITDHVQTGGGAVVTKSITQPGLYVGSPSRFIR
ncbi:acetyltransferase [Chitinophaga sp. 212800010-3]|uniref:acetyltransferase n=1 Tax=unclassified Chitinophaga TaxID=2619133 RepID=UPI002DF548E4|nr:PglD-N domain-containing protein [Chitinophaga sp. 212800010-3]